MKSPLRIIRAYWEASQNRRGRITPKELVLHLTKRCNARCPHCLWLLKDERFFANDDMAFDSAKQIIIHFYHIGIRSISPQAEGEVLLYKRYEDIVLHCYGLGYDRIRLITNGLLLHKHIDFVLKYLDITISIDGYDAPTYILHRGGTERTFEKVVNNVTTLVARRTETAADSLININCIVGRFNYEYIKPMIKFAEDVGVDSVSFGNYHPTNEDLGKWGPLYYDDQVVLDYFRSIISQDDYRVAIRLPSLYGRRTSFRCEMLFNTVVVGSGGSFSPCCHIATDPYWGAFREDPMGYNANRLALFRKQFSAARRYEELPDICRECPRLSPQVLIFKPGERKWYCREFIDNA